MARPRGSTRLVGAYSPTAARLWGTFAWLNARGERVTVTAALVDDFRRYHYAADARPVGVVTLFVRRLTWGSALKAPRLPPDEPWRVLETVE